MNVLYGVVGLGGAPVERRQLMAMGRALGVDDDEVMWRWTDGDVGLGSGTIGSPTVVEPPGPAFGTAGDLVLIADGRVDDRRRLGGFLGMSRDDAQGLPVPGLLLRAYERWGKACVERLVGEFTFAVWDARARELIIGCSAPLARPVCYHVSGESLAFASLARGLFPLPQVARRIDEERVASFLTRADTGRHRTFFEGINRLLAGQLLTVTPLRHEVRQWWRPDLSSRLELGSGEEYTRRLRVLLEDVIEDHLERAGNTGIMLSGGLDSSTVAAVVAARLGRRGRSLPAYCEVPAQTFIGRLPDGRHADETPFVQSLARRHPNIELTLLRDCQTGLLTDVERLFASSESPVQNASNRGWIEAIYQLASQAGIQTLLSGDQGNLTVSWSGAGVLSELLARGHLRQVVLEARAITRAGRAGSTWRAIAAQGLGPLLPPWMFKAVERARVPAHVRGENPYSSYSLIAPAFASELGLARRDARRYRRYLKESDQDVTASRLRVLLSTAAMSAQHNAGYLATFGVDTRTPLADRRLVEFCLRVPEAQCARAGETRLLLRRAMTDRLPAAVVNSRTRGLQASYWAERVREERLRLLETVRDFESDSLTSRVLDLPRLRQLLETWPAQPELDPDQLGLYRGAIGAAMMTGAFLLWAQSSASWTARPGA